MKKRNSVKEQTKLSFQLGGTTPMPGTGVINTTANVPTTGFTPYVAPTIPGFTKPQLQNTQYTTATQTTNLPTFLQTVGTKPGEYDELRRYVNDAGQVRQIPFKNGQPIYPIPEGYRFEAEDTTQIIEATTGPVANVGQQQQDDGGGDGGGGTGVSGSVQGPAGGTTGLAGVQSALSDVTGYFSGKPAQAQPYGGTTLSGLTNLGTITDFSNNISGVQDALGVYGTGPINLGIVGSMLTGNVLGALASASGIGPSTEAFGQAAPTGHGAYSTADLEAYSRGKMSKTQQNELGISMNQNQAQARAQVQRAIGTPITGIVGYKKGDISPITGTPVNSKGRVVNFNGSSKGVDPGFATMGDWVDAMKASVETGYYGGPLSKAEVANLSEKGKKGYAAKARALGYNEQGEGPAGSGGPAAEAGITGGYGPTGRQSSTGRQDYSGGISQDARDSTTGVGMNEGQGTNAGQSAPAGGYGGFGEDPGFDGNEGGGSQDGGSSCFAAGTKFFMEDGSLKNIEDIKIGDVLQTGGKVRTTIVGDGLYEDWYMYGTTKVTGTHSVFENGKWTRVANSEKAVPTDKDEFIYTLVNEKHRLISEDGIIYGDYDEVDNLDIEDGLLEMMNLQDAVEKAA